MMIVPLVANSASCPEAGARAEADGDGLAGGVGHLRGDGALPDQLVDAGVVGVDLAGDLLGRAERVAGGPDGLVGLLRVLHLLGVGAGLVGQVLP